MYVGNAQGDNIQTLLTRKILCNRMLHDFLLHTITTPAHRRSQTGGSQVVRGPNSRLNTGGIIIYSTVRKTVATVLLAFDYILHVHVAHYGENYSMPAIAKFGLHGTYTVVHVHVHAP